MEASAETSRELISVVADVWRDRRIQLGAATVQEARLVAAEEIEVGA